MRPIATVTVAACRHRRYSEMCYIRHDACFVVATTVAVAGGGRCILREIMTSLVHCHHQQQQQQLVAPPTPHVD